MNSSTGSRSRRRRPRGPRRGGGSGGKGFALALSGEKVCAGCGKPESICVCESISPLKNRITVVVLQHPQEPDKLLGTAQLLTASLQKSKLHIGLSVPNLKKILGDQPFDPKRWGVLYLGSGVKSKAAAGPESLGSGPGGLRPGVYFTTKDGALLTDREQKETRASLDGIILLDGTWSQAKALWWRNPWLLKLKRMILIPRDKSCYGELRREPRGECLSTLETAAETLTSLGEAPEIEKQLKATFTTFLGRYREALKKGAAAQKPAAPVSEV